MIDAGAINVWTCETCNGHVVAIHVDEGATSMFLSCRATAGCQGRAVSAMYPSPPIPADLLAELAFEWYMPSPRQLRRMEPAVRDHCERGGLLIRPLSDLGKLTAKEIHGWEG